MALFRCGGGPAESETTLWSNPDTTVDFTDQTVTLSDDYTNYSRIKIVTQLSKSNTDSMSVIYETSEIVTGSSWSTFNKFTPSSPANFSKSTDQNVTIREYLFKGATSVEISAALRVHPSAGGTYNDTSIPVSIIGIK